ncbi:MAG: potassium channel protein [Planctomycetota bacterium]|jgi:voltage-gated potassium channel|nr:MAG: potassium channel protein [Planctomycetota bacterium]
MRRLLQIPLLIFALLLLGALGLHLLTEMSLFDSFYHAVILLTTVGYSEPTPLTVQVKMFIVTYLAFALGLFTYSAFQFGQLLVNADLQKYWERRRMDTLIEKTSRHFIVCGYGRMGSTLCEYLHSRRQPFVVIDQDEKVLDDNFRQQKWLFVLGDSSQDETLERAGIHRARGLTTVLPTDADNLYVVLSARLLNKAIPIVARASDDRAAQKMMQAGATRVMNPFSSGAIRMARFMLAPSIENFVEVTESHGVDWEIADVQVPETSVLVGQKLSETGLRDSGIMLLGVCRMSGEKFFPPPAHLIIEPGDKLFAFGNSEGVAILSSLLEKRRNA